MMRETLLLSGVAMIVAVNLSAFAGSIQEAEYPGWIQVAGDKISNIGEDTRRQTWTRSDGLNIGRHNAGYPLRDVRTCTVHDGTTSGFNKFANLFRYGKCGEHSVKVYEEIRPHKKSGMKFSAKNRRKKNTVRVKGKGNIPRPKNKENK